MKPAPGFLEFWSLRYSAGGLLPTRIMSQRLGAIAAFGAGRAGWSPTGVTLLGLATFAVAAVLLATLPDRWESALFCLLLLQAGYALDCADGQLARATDRSSPRGAWLDVGCDYLRNVLLGGAAAIWMMRSGLTPALAIVCGTAYAAGTVLYLHTLTVTRQAAATESLGSSSRLPLRELAGSVLDTPTVMLCISLFRGTPSLLGCYLVLMGILSLGAAVRQARRLPSA